MFAIYNNLIAIIRNMEREPFGYRAYILVIAVRQMQQGLFNCQFSITPI